jgi:FkbM family methyltransferase
MGIVESLQHAVSHSADETTEFKRNLRGHTSHRLDESHFGNHPDRSEYETITMQTTTADDIAAERNLGEIDMLSVTVNRFEAAVLEGAERTLERTKYVVIPGNRDRQYGDAHAVLTDAGFERIEIGNRGNLYERTSG